MMVPAASPRRPSMPCGSVCDGSSVPQGVGPRRLTRRVGGPPVTGLSGVVDCAISRGCNEAISSLTASFSSLK
jgi:hypothetical protein